MFDKTGIVELAAGLHELGWRAGVERRDGQGAGRRAGIPVTDVAELTGVPAILGHRVVTLHPTVHGGILADLDDPAHRADLAAYGIEPIALVVANLYPFAEQPGIEHDRHRRPGHGAGRGQEPRPRRRRRRPGRLRRSCWTSCRSAGALGAATRRRLARKAFAHTAAYDAAIVTWLDDTDPAGRPVLPPTLHLALELAQAAALRREPPPAGGALPAHRRPVVVGRRRAARRQGAVVPQPATTPRRRGGWSTGSATQPAAVVIKHANPCGAAVAGDITTAYQRAHEGDPVSAFGGIVAVNRPVPRALAEALAPVFTEVVVAPGFDDDALALLTAKKNLRVLDGAAARGRRRSTCAPSTAASLVQKVDRVGVDRAAWQVVTKVAPTEEQWVDLELAWRVCAAVSSNAIVLVQDGQAVGIGAGQQNRRRLGRIAAEKAAGRAAGGACASDAFFPFRDGARRASRPRASPRSSSPAARSATTRSSPPPTSTASPWSSPASATSATDSVRADADGSHGRVGSARLACRWSGRCAPLQRSVTHGWRDRAADSVPIRWRPVRVTTGRG